METVIIGVVIIILVVATPVIWLFVQDTLESKRRPPFPDHGRSRPERNSLILWGMTLLAIAYASTLRYRGALTGRAQLDGTIGVILGLYICSHPAANAVNMLFFDRHRLQQTVSEGSLAGWLALNLLTLAAGWMDIYLGIIRLVAVSA